MDQVSIYMTISWHRILLSLSLKPGAGVAGHPDTLRLDFTNSGCERATNWMWPWEYVADKYPHGAA